MTSERLESLFTLLVLFVAGAGCAARPLPGTVFVQRLRFDGVESVDESDLRDRLGTRSPSMILGLVESPWADRPVFDRYTFSRDLARIVRYYRSRGYYDVQLDEPEIRTLGDKVDVRVRVREGPVVRVRSLRLRTPNEAAPGIAPALRATLYGRLELRPGDRFDEKRHDAGKRALLAALQNASYARARVNAEVVIDPAAHAADVVIDLDPGRPRRFGRVTIEGADTTPAWRVRRMIEIQPGRPYSLDAVAATERLLFDLGTYASVQIRPVLDAPTDAIPVRIRLTEARTGSLSAGSGIGFTSTRTDAHVVGKWEQANLLGGLRRLRVEDHPQIVATPSVFDPQRISAGNLLSMQFTQPGFPDGRTSFIHRGVYDWGPDVEQQFFRHLLRVSQGFERLLGRHSRLSLLYSFEFFAPYDVRAQNLFIERYFLSFLEQRLVADYRDDPLRPRRGFYGSVQLREAGGPLFGDFAFVSIQPEARLYVPLGDHLGLHGRLSLGAIVPLPYDERNPASSVPVTYRFYAGGPNSNRGYAYRGLGPRQCIRESAVGQNLCQTFAPTGGLALWEASLELHVRLPWNLGAVLFVDLGDVSERWQWLTWPRTHLTGGFGLRYDTLLGPLRLDIGVRAIGDPREPTKAVTFLGELPLMLSLMIGEAF